MIAHLLRGGNNSLFIKKTSNHCCHHVIGMNAKQPGFRNFTMKPAVPENKKTRELAKLDKLQVLGLHAKPFPSVSSDPKVFEIQSKLFSYDKGGAGKKSGRKILKKALTKPPLVDWYMDDWRKLRAKESRLKIHNIPQYVQSVLGAFKMPKAGVDVKYGPHNYNSVGLQRWEAREKASQIMKMKPTVLKKLAVTSLISERRRKASLLRMKKRGKAPPAKGKGKRATTGAKKAGGAGKK